MSIWLTRKQAAAYIKARIATGSVSLLAKLARTNDGPRCYTAGKAALYDPADLDEWIAHRLRPMGIAVDVDKPSAEIRPAIEMGPVNDQVREAFDLLRNLGISP